MGLKMIFYRQILLRSNFFVHIVLYKILIILELFSTNIMSQLTPHLNRQPIFIDFVNRTHRMQYQQIFKLPPFRLCKGSSISFNMLNKVFNNLTRQFRLLNIFQFVINGCGNGFFSSDLDCFTKRICSYNALPSLGRF